MGLSALKEPLTLKGLLLIGLEGLVLDVAPAHHFHFFFYGTLQNKHTDMLESVIGLPWSEMSTLTVDFVCERVFKCVRGLYLAINVDVDSKLHV